MREIETRILEIKVPYHSEILYIPQYKKIFRKWKDFRKPLSEGSRYSSWIKKNVENFLDTGNTFDMSYRKHYNPHNK